MGYSGCGERRFPHPGNPEVDFRSRFQRERMVSLVIVCRVRQTVS